MVIRWFQSWLKTKIVTVAKTPEQNLMDIAHEVLARDALERNEELKGLEKLGSSVFNQRRKKERIRSKVKNVLGSPVTGLPVTEEESFEMVDEITEKIGEVCEADPRMNRLFDASLPKK